jgi:hypothetical protein
MLLILLAFSVYLKKITRYHEAAITEFSVEIRQFSATLGKDSVKTSVL